MEAPSRLPPNFSILVLVMSKVSPMGAERVLYFVALLLDAFLRDHAGLEFWADTWTEKSPPSTAIAAPR
jgi:hypothetical protein